MQNIMKKKKIGQSIQWFKLSEEGSEVMNNQKIPVILAGGSGSRLWPLSRQAYPKQFLPLIASEETLLQSTVLRVMQQEDMSRPIIICHEDHRYIVAEQLRQIQVIPEAIILEPEGKNTAAAIALAVSYLVQKKINAWLYVMPADHAMTVAKDLHEAFDLASEAVSLGKLVAFGVKAKYPETAYGYIQKDTQSIAENVFPIARFVEKPDLATATAYVNANNYYWNCGIFAFDMMAYWRELLTLAPVIAKQCELAMSACKADGDFIRPDPVAFRACPSESIDYAVMEKSKETAIVVLDTHWNDVGSWNALMREQDLDDSGNVKIGDVVVQNVHNSYLRSEHKLLAVSGVKDHVIVVTDDAVLVAHHDHCQEVKTLVNTLKANKRSEAEHHRRVHRPWGSYQTIVEGTNYKVKKIIVLPKHSLSLQRHQHRSEHWVVISGDAWVQNGDRTLLLQPNQSTFIPAKTAHRLSNLTTEPLELIEVQVGHYVGEDDIERLADVYGRVENALLPS